MRLGFRRRGFGNKLGDGRHGFRSGVVGGQHDAESTRIGQICLFLENRFPCLCESSAKDEVNVTTFAFGIKTHQASFVHLDFPS